jgi:hypothetical protein
LVTRGQIEAVLEFAAPGAAIEGKLPEIASGGRCGARYFAGAKISD